MEKKISLIIFICSLVGLLIFSILWLFFILFPFMDWAELLSSLGITYEGPISYILEWLFLNIYFIGMIVCGFVALIFRIIARKALK